MENTGQTNKSIKINDGYSNNPNALIQLNYTTTMKGNQDANVPIFQQFIIPNSHPSLDQLDHCNLGKLGNTKKSISCDDKYYLTYRVFVIVVTLPQHKNSFKVNANVLWKNGEPLIFQNQFSSQILTSMNNYPQSNPFFIKNKQNTIQLSYKIKSYRSNSFLSLLNSKMEKVINKFQDLLYQYGLIGPHLCGFQSKKLRLFKLSLKYKERIARILQKNHIMKKQNQRIRKKNQEGFKETSNTFEVQKNLQSKIEEQKDEIITVCQYFDQIEQQKNNLANTNFFESNKFNIMTAKFSLLTIEKNEQNMQNQQNSDEVKAFIGQQIIEMNSTGIKKQQKILVKKIVKEDLPAKTYNKAKEKLQRQINIIKSIKFGKQYFLTYYFTKDNYKKKLVQGQSSSQNLSLMMDYCQTSLSFYIDNDLYDLDFALSLFLELIKSVEMLHKSGIVHRDLKPENIMMSNSNLKENQKKTKIKVIDFSDSALMSQKVTSQLSNILGHSLPYSPFQCNFDCSFGINNPEIDIWSLGIILHQLVYKKLPQIYHKITKMQQFTKGIKQNELSINLLQKYHKKSFIGIIQQILNQAIAGCLNLRQCDRMNINYLKQIILQVKSMNLGMKNMIGLYFNQF